MRDWTRIIKTYDAYFYDQSLSEQDFSFEDLYQAFKQRLLEDLVTINNSHLHDKSIDLEEKE